MPLKNSLSPLIKSSKRTKRIKRRHASLFLRFKTLSVIALSFLTIIFLHQFFFTIKKINCQSLSGPSQVDCPPSIINLLKKYQNKSLLALNRDEIKKEIESNWPVDEVKIKISLPSKLGIEIKNQQNIKINLFHTSILPTLSLNASTSALLKSPLLEIENFLSSQSAQRYLLLPDGQLNINQDEKNKQAKSEFDLIFHDKPEEKKLISAYLIFQKLKFTLSFEKLFILENNLFLKINNLPDIIIPLGIDMDKLNQSLQALSELATIKKNSVLIDLRFKHPIVR